MHENDTPTNVGSNAGLGPLTRRAELRDGAAIAVWGCVVCSNVWAASDKFLLGAVWIVCAVAILLVESGTRKA